MTNIINTQTEAPSAEGFRKTAAKVCFFFTTLFAVRCIAAVGLSFVPFDEMDPSAAFFLRTAISAFALQIFPSFIAVFAFRLIGMNDVRALYAKPKRLAKAIGNFPAVYGLGIFVNILTMAVMYFLFPQETALEKSVNTINGAAPPDMQSAVVLFVMLTVIAPVFEEFVFRGAVQTALEPYGNGMAILVSGISFGVFHGNFNQAFYATVLGIALAYIRYATKSLVPGMIIHALVNSMAGIILIFLATDEMQRALGGNSLTLTNVPESDSFIVSLFFSLLICILITAFIGTVLAFIKIKNIRKYKIEKRFSEMSGAAKFRTIITRPFAVVSFLLVIDCFAGGLIANAVVRLIGGGA